MLDRRRNFAFHQSAVLLLIDLFLARKQWLRHFHQVASALEHSLLHPAISDGLFFFFYSSSANVLFNELASMARVPFALHLFISHAFWSYSLRRFVHNFCILPSCCLSLISFQHFIFFPKLCQSHTEAHDLKRCQMNCMIFNLPPTH